MVRSNDLADLTPPRLLQCTLLSYAMTASVRSTREDIESRDQSRSSSVLHGACTHEISSAIASLFLRAIKDSVMWQINS